MIVPDPDELERRRAEATNKVLSAPPAPRAPVPVRQYGYLTMDDYCSKQRES